MIRHSFLETVAGIVPPWHSVLRDVHHNNALCTEGNNIEFRYYRHGTGWKRLCDHCKRLATLPVPTAPTKGRSCVRSP